MCGGCRPAKALLEVARGFRRVDPATVEDDLTALAACALGARCLGSAGQLDTLARAMEPFALSDAQVGLDDLLLDLVLERWAGTPLVLCAIAADAGARAGLDVAVAGDGQRHVVVHREGCDVAYDPAYGVRALGAEERRHLRLRCGHQVAFSVLATVVERATRAGDLAVALHATELRLRLPLAAPLRARVEAERSGLRASLN